MECEGKGSGFKSLGKSSTINLVVTNGYKISFTLLNIFLFDVNFEKSTIRLYFLFISFMLAKFLEN